MISSARTYRWLTNRASGKIRLPRQPQPRQAHHRQSTQPMRVPLLHRRQIWRCKLLLLTWRKRVWLRQMRLLRPWPPTDTAGAQASAWRRTASAPSYGMIFPPRIPSRSPFRPLSMTKPSPTKLEQIVLRVFYWNRQY
jgi:hypothetical protein